MLTTKLKDGEFLQFRTWLHRTSGISLAPSKQPLVSGRLAKRLQARGLHSYGDYFRLIMQPGEAAELQMALDLLTTNETYFFREPQHFDDLAVRAAAAQSAGEFNVWSAASSSGEEAYSIAMLLGDRLGLSHPWQIHGTDLSTAMVEAAKVGLYPMERARNVPADYLKRFCLKGHGPYSGQVLMMKELRAKARFQTANLMQPLPTSLPRFDVIFLRNVLIYFDGPSKADIVRRVIERLKPDGVLYTGHAESLTGLDLPLRAVASAIYQHG